MKYWYVSFIILKDGSMAYGCDGISGQGDFPIGSFILGTKKKLKATHCVVLFWKEITQKQFDDFGLAYAEARVDNLKKTKPN